MRISDWSSDVCSSDLVVDGVFQGSTEVANDGIYSVEITGWTPVFAADGVTVISATFDYTATLLDNTLAHDELGQDDIINMLTVTARFGRAQCRERVCQYV